MHMTYEQGIIDGVKLWGTACSGQGNCDSCPVSVLTGANVTCAEFAKKFPEKMAGMFSDMTKEDHTYYNEYCLRFPNCNLPVEVLAECACRKAVFEGNVNCEVEGESACVDCWNERYYGDVTDTGEEDT